MNLLYRGVNSSLYEELNGALSPKEIGKPFSSFVCCGAPHAVCGSGVQCGESVTNEAIFHQWKQKGYPTSGISTTPHIERAIFYALQNEKFTIGYIYELSVPKLLELGVSMHKVSDFATVPAIPDDDEHILVANDYKTIPIEAANRIIKIEKVSNNIINRTEYAAAT